MSRQAQINKLIQRLRGQWPQVVFEEDYDGSCPCFEGTAYFDGGYWFRVEGSCWRVSKHISEGYQDLEIATNLPQRDAEKIALVIQQELDKQEWYNPYHVTLRVYGEPTCTEWPTVKSGVPS